MKIKMAALVALLLVVGSLQVAHGSSAPQAVATGKLTWTRASVCEHPLHPGLFLQYYLTDGCGHNLFLYGRLTQGMVGSTIWAEGTLVEGGWCKVLDITRLNLCLPPEP